MGVREDNVVEQLKRKNPKALEFVVDNYGGLIKSVVQKTLFNFENSGYIEECMNDVFLAIWENCNKFSGVNSFKAWIGAIAKYKAIDYQRKYIKSLYHENVEELELKEEADIDKELLQQECNKEIMKLLSNLTPSDRDIFIRKYFEEESTNHIAKELGLKSSAVNNRLSRGRRKLKELFSGEVNSQ